MRHFGQFSNNVPNVDALGELFPDLSVEIFYREALGTPVLINPWTFVEGMC